MPDLFTYRYPELAGSKGGGASRLAADKLTDSGGQETLEQRVMALFDRRPDWTPDEAASALDLHPSDIRPRFSELTLPRINKSGRQVRAAFIRKTGETRESGRGNPQHVYRRLT